ncbi:MAG TPA: hypothetical protein VFT56_09930 [Sphingomonas sp.]|nr:hypothetical protein [Sphingomonas sp.]
MFSRRVAAGMALMSSAVALAQGAADRPGRPISFVACPQFRDTARQCWLAESGGKTYYIGAFGIGTPPQLLHRVLVEGVAHDDELSCGGINIDPVHISPLPELDYSCDAVLPDNGTAPREGSIFDLPPAVLARNGSDVPAPPPLRANTSFSVTFDFDRAVLNLLNQAKVEMIAKAILKSPVRRVIVTGHAGRSRLSDGSRMLEAPQIADERMRAVSNALIGIGVTAGIVEEHGIDSTAIDAPVSDVDSREVTVEVLLSQPAR